MRSLMAWRSWPEVTIKVTGNLPHDINTWVLYKAYGEKGEIVKIEILRGASFRHPGALITFRPPPPMAFWESPRGLKSLFLGTPSKKHGTYKVTESLQALRKDLTVRSPLNPDVPYPQQTALNVHYLSFGIMHQEGTVMEMHRSGPGKTKLVLNLWRRQVEIYFCLHFESRKKTEKREYKIEIPLKNLNKIFVAPYRQTSERVLTIPLQSPPRYFRKLQNISDCHDKTSNIWNDYQAWFRQTEISHELKSRRTGPCQLHDPMALIDIGRWQVLRLVIQNANSGLDTNFTTVTRALGDYNIPTIAQPDFEVIPKVDCEIWEVLNRSTTLLSLADETPHLQFPVRYQLEACMSHGYLDEHNISVGFLRRLAEMDTDLAKAILEKVVDQKIRYFDPMDVFSIQLENNSSLGRKVPKYCQWQRQAVVTPTTVYFNNPTCETTNRVVRHFFAHGDCFLRVKFTDEKHEGRIHSKDDNRSDEVFSRVKRVLDNGIVIGERHYVFLAFGNSQLREHGAWFFCNRPDMNVDHIRAWMGRFSHINSVAKYAARLGQAFSTSRAINSTQVVIKEIDDVKKGKNCFTDGAGKISPFLAQFIAWELGLPSGADCHPSVFQFRLAGCKGILTVWPECREREVHIRPSQYKFGAENLGLEIVRVSSFASATLNRQLVVLLSTMGVSDNAILSKQQKMLSEINEAMSKESVALRRLQRYTDANQMTPVLAGMITDGFMKRQEPFFMTILHLWRAWGLKGLKEKARIEVEQSAFLLGCTDETQTLRGHMDLRTSDEDPNEPMEQRVKKLPEIFLQIPDSEQKGKYKTIQGLCLLGRNPSLHPGDIRVVMAVDNPRLRHIKNAVVLPQTGDRDIANMCSGGDLDGDDYFVIWDPELLPTEWNHEPMNYDPPPTKLVDKVSIGDITEFFVDFMKQDRLGRIGSAHLGNADFSPYGVKDDKCILLSNLHSMAVDFAKSGTAATYSGRLGPPRWPHFQPKEHLPPGQQYHSKKILGQLYDKIESATFAPQYEMPFDERILTACDLDDDILIKAAECKDAYDEAIKRVMAQYDIATEFEVWTTFVLKHNALGNDYKFYEEIGRAAQALKQRFRERCCEAAGVEHRLLVDVKKIGRFAVAMYTVTARAVQTALAERHESLLSSDIGENAMPFISFPWIFSAELGRIACGELSELAALPRPRILPLQQRATEKKRRPSAPELHLLDAPGDANVIGPEGVTQLGQGLRLFEDKGKPEPEFVGDDLLSFGDPVAVEEDVEAETKGEQPEIVEEDVQVDAEVVELQMRAEKGGAEELGDL